jgi:protein CpxP
MNRILKIAVASAFAAGATLALAQAPTPPAGPGYGPGFHRPQMRMADRAEARLAYIKTALKITPAQEAQWNAFADHVRKTSKDMEQRFQGATRPARGERPNAIQRLEIQQAFMAEQTKRLTELLAVEKPLYESLSAEQKKVADEVLGQRGRMAQRGGPGFRSRG